MKFRSARDVVEQLEAADIEFAVIGASAFPIYGYVRSTLDLDFLVFDRRVFDESTWSDLRARGISHQIHVTDDDDDPILGVVRVGSPDRRHCDVVMPRGAWHSDVIKRARQSGKVIEIDGISVPAATLTDLILLKLNAAGPNDLRDIEELLNAQNDESVVVEKVESQMKNLDTHIQVTWDRFKSTRSANGT